ASQREKSPLTPEGACRQGDLLRRLSPGEAQGSGHGCTTCWLRTSMWQDDAKAPDCLGHRPLGRVSATEPPGARRHGERSRAVVQHPPRQRFLLFPGCAAPALYSSSLGGKRRAAAPPWAAAPQRPCPPVTRLPACRLPAGTCPATGVCGDLWEPLLD